MTGLTAGLRDRRSRSHGSPCRGPDAEREIEEDGVRKSGEEDASFEVLGIALVVAEVVEPGLGVDVRILALVVVPLVIRLRDPLEFGLAPILRVLDVLGLPRGHVPGSQRHHDLLPEAGAHPPSPRCGRTQNAATSSSGVVNGIGSAERVEFRAGIVETPDALQDGHRPASRTGWRAAVMIGSMTIGGRSMLGAESGAG